MKEIKNIIIRNKNKKELLKDYNQNGGVLLGSGGFGCVLSPYVKCPRKRISGQNLLSKIVILNREDDDDMETLYNEIDISKSVLKIDKKQKYLSPIINYCEYDYTTDRNDIKNINKVKMGSTLKHRSKSNSKQKKTKKCIINKNPKFIVVNLILKNSGFDLIYYIKKSTPNEKKLYINIIKILFMIYYKVFNIYIKIILYIRI